MKPGRLHHGVCIRGDDGFVMAKYEHIVDEENFEHLMQMLKAENVNRDQWYNARFIERHFIKYLKSFCAESFGIGWYEQRPKEEDDWKQKRAYLIAFRSKKDLFKFNMRFGAKRVRWWRSSTGFTIIGTHDDDYVPAKAGEKWNKEDPHGFIRP